MKNGPRKENGAYVILIHREAVVNTGGQDQEIALLDLDANPLVLRIANIEIPGSLQDVADFFVFVHVLVVEHLDLVFVDGAHGGRRDGDLVAVDIVSSLCYVFDIGGRCG